MRVSTKKKKKTGVTLTGLVHMQYINFFYFLEACCDDHCLFTIKKNKKTSIDGLTLTSLLKIKYPIIIMIFY